MARHRPPLAELRPRRVCLIKPSALGDIVQTLPVLEALRRQWPQAHIAWVVKGSLAGVLRGHPGIDEIIELGQTGNPKSEIRKPNSAASFFALLRRLRAGNFDLTIDLQGLLRSALMTWATGAARRVGFSNAREGSTLAYTDRVFVRTWEMPNWERYGLVARAFGHTGPLPPGRLPIRDEHHGFAARELAGLPRPLLAISPGAQWETKRWPPAHFAELAARAQAEFGAGVVLVGGPGERALCDAVASGLRGPVLNLAERTGLLELAAVCSAADVFLSGDTGPMHVAAAVGTPAVSVFTCTSTVQAGPRGCESLITATAVPCAASYRKTCRSMICMPELSPARVWPKLRAALAEAAARRQAG
jgi:lipopolysaccharide heptosyltransferase I